jgi:hypothetical protein
MHVSASKTAQKPHRRVLLVGFPPLARHILGASLSEVAEVLAVPFPGDRFDRAAEEFAPTLVVVDVTYLDEVAVRPLITHRFLSGKPLVAYVRDACQQGWVDDLRTGATRPLDDPSVAGLTRLTAPQPHLRVVDGR